MSEVKPEDELVESTDEHSGPETFDREYVEGLRRENATHRARAVEVSRRLHTELVRADGRLADPADLPYDPTHVDDPTAVSLAIDELLKAKPHFASRVPNGNVGQGDKDAGEPVSIISELKKLV